MGGKPRALKPVMEYAGDLLARQDYSVKKLAEKLRQKGYSAAETEQAVAKLIDRHYLDDARSIGFAWEYMFNNTTWSLRQISCKLAERGYERDLIAETIEATDIDLRTERDRQLAERLARQKYGGNLPRKKNRRDPAAKGYPDWQPIAGWLYGRGFAGDICRGVAQTLVEEARAAERED